MGASELTIEQLLAEDLLNQVSYIAGEDGRFRPIDTVQTIETERVEKYHQAAMLYLLDNLELLKNTTKMATLINQLADSQAAGLVIMEDDVKYFGDTLRQLADQVHLSILQLPHLPSFSDGMQIFFEAMLHQKTKQLRNIIQNNQRLADLVIKHPKVESVLDLGAEILGTPVVLLDSHFKVVFASEQLRNQENSLTEFFRQTRIDYFQLEKQITVNKGQDSFTLFPLFPAFKENKAFVAVLNYRESDEFKIILQQLLMNTLSFVNSRIDMLNESDFRNMSGFLLNVLDGGISTNILDKRLLDLKLNPAATYSCVMTHVIASDTGKMVNYHVLEQIQQLIMWFINEYDMDAILFSWRQRLILLLDSHINAQHFVGALQQFIDDKIPGGYQFLIGYSNSQAKIADLSDIFKEALEATRSVEQNPSLKAHKYQPKYVQELISLIPRDEATAFTQKFLAPLLRMDNEEEKAALLTTLQNYFYFHQQLAQVARNMFVHRNTIIYRIKKIEGLLKVDLSDPQTAQNVQFALLLNQSTKNGG